MKTLTTTVAWRSTVLSPPFSETLVPTGAQLNRALAVANRLANPGITVWAGSPGLGKTATAGILCRTLTERGGPRAAYIDVAPPDSASRSEVAALRAILSAAIGPIPERMVRSRSATGLAEFLLTTMRASAARILIIDEAGRLRRSGLEAIGILVDQARAAVEPFHVVLVGMRNLPGLLRANERVASRVVAWEQFDPLSANAFGQVLQHSYPQLSARVKDKSAYDDLVESLHAATGGSLREAFTAVTELLAMDEMGKLRINAENLMAMVMIHRKSRDSFLGGVEARKGPPKRKYQSAMPKPAR